MKPYTVIFYIDGDYGVDTFVQRVYASDHIAAFENALVEAQESGGSSSGRSIPSHAWEHATEIATFAGHLENATE